VATAELLANPWRGELMWEALALLPLLVVIDAASMVRANPPAMLPESLVGVDDVEKLCGDVGIVSTVAFSVVVVLLRRSFLMLARDVPVAVLDLSRSLVVRPAELRPNMANTPCSRGARIFTWRLEFPFDECWSLWKWKPSGTTCERVAEEMCLEARSEELRFVRRPYPRGWSCHCLLRRRWLNLEHSLFGQPLREQEQARDGCECSGSGHTRGDRDTSTDESIPV
jgi:hypothetical protein